MKTFLSCNFNIDIHKDKVFLLDLVGCTCFYIELILQALQFQNSYLRFYKAIVVLKIVKIFYFIKYMETIMFVIKMTGANFLNFGIILFFTLLTYSVFGIYFFGNQLKPDSDRFIYFDNILHSFMSVFDLMTYDNWYSLLLKGIDNDDQNNMFIFIITFIVAGNMILLNLFIAIMLDGFEYVTDEIEKKKIYSNQKSLKNMSMNITVFYIKIKKKYIIIYHYFKKF